MSAKEVTLTNNSQSGSGFFNKINELDKKWEKWAEDHPIASKVIALIGLIISLGLFALGFIFDPILPISVPALVGGAFLFAMSVTTLAMPILKK